MIGGGGVGDLILDDMIGGRVDDMIGRGRIEDRVVVDTVQTLVGGERDDIRKRIKPLHLKARM